MNKKILQLVLENKHRFVPHIFTEKQHAIIRKYLDKKKLSANQKTYLYSSISKKIKALSLLDQEFHIYGSGMIPSRAYKAKELLKSFSCRAFISGSFLYKHSYSDIDIYIISNKRVQYRKGDYHYTHITESDLRKPMIASATRYCVSTIALEDITVQRKRYGLSNTILAYEQAVAEHLEGEGFKTLKHLITEYHLIVKNKLLDSRELTEQYESISKSKNAIHAMNEMTKSILLSAYSKTYLYVDLGKFTAQIDKDIKTLSANENLIIYKRLFDEIKDECKRTET
ncbi:MAG: hypothetical protein ACOCU6_03295 [Nanoarchaeota archaeon]